MVWIRHYCVLSPNSQEPTALYPFGRMWLKYTLILWSCHWITHSDLHFVIPALATSDPINLLSIFTFLIIHDLKLECADALIELPITTVRKGNSYIYILMLCLQDHLNCLDGLHYICDITIGSTCKY